MKNIVLEWRNQMRIRFKPWARPELEASDFYRDNPEELKDKWIKELSDEELEELVSFSESDIFLN